MYLGCHGLVPFLLLLSCFLIVMAVYLTDVTYTLLVSSYRGHLRRYLRLLP